MTPSERSIWVLSHLAPFGIDSRRHSQRSLRDHLLATCDLLRSWGCHDALCEAGLVHSVYGTESYLPMSLSLEHRPYLQALIGVEAELLAYWFGAHEKESLWDNLDREEGFRLRDRHMASEVAISEAELGQMITLTLANWLEQRPRAKPESRRLRESEFRRAERYLPAVAFQQFLTAYEGN